MPGAGALGEGGRGKLEASKASERLVSRKPLNLVLDLLWTTYSQTAYSGLWSGPSVVAEPRA